MSMTTSQLRQAFFQFFEAKGHQQVSSCSLVPADDPTLLFTNAGMNQFKDVFTGKEVRDYSRAVSSQRCVRAGGKHNDLENVGYTARHHTFFEMLGNFSFGDYFKSRAIEFAWEFLTEELKLPVDKLLVTIYHDDEEAYNIWHQHIGLPADKIIRIATSDNFWSMGDIGPCGPCSEIFYDHGEHIWGGPPGSPEEDGDRFIEIWNLVFMQFERQADGELQPLPKPSIDTGMGLERMSAILQSVHSNYEIDLFQALINKAAQLLTVTDKSNDSLKVIADHIRSCSFLITDGVIPSNDGRGYVLRRIIRRAIRHGYKLGAQEPFFHQLVAELVKLMGDAYPELVTKQMFIEKVLRIEEEQFAATIERGMSMLETAITQLQADTIPGDVVFKLYDTYGFPADLTNDIARERQLQIDQAGFEAAMAEQRQRAQQASKFSASMGTNLPLTGNSVFTGYNEIKRQSTVSQLVVFNELVDAAVDGDAIIVVADTPFYAEAGGQVGDTGRIEAPHGYADVLDTQKQDDLILHHCRVVGRINTNDTLLLQVDGERREHIKKNHSATHLLHAALRQVLGPNVAQKGSLVEPDKLRFDFSHLEAMTADEIEQVEQLVNTQILHNQPLHTKLMALEEAKAAGALALFGEKYDDQVRVVSMGDFSTELCGGTHVDRSGDIGLFKILSEQGIASGVRRIEAVTGQYALQQWQQQAGLIQRLASELKTDSAGLLDKLAQQKDQLKAQEKSLQRLKDKLAAQLASQLLAEFVDVAGVPTLVTEVEDVDAKSLRGLIDSMKTKQQDFVAVLAVVSGSNVNLIAGVSSSLTDRIKAGELVKVAAAEVGGKGGGRPDLAQAGGNQPENLHLALNAVKNYINNTIGNHF